MRNIQGIRYLEYVKETRYLTLYKRYKNSLNIFLISTSKAEPERLEKQLMVYSI